MNIWSYILKRVLLMIPTLFGVVAITFAVIQFVPGGPVEQAMLEMKGRGGGGEASGGGAASGASAYRGRQGIDEQRIAEIKQLYGFDKPPVERFWTMLKGFLTFDLGKSFYHHGDVWTLVKCRTRYSCLPPSSFLSGARGAGLGLFIHLLSHRAFSSHQVPIT